VFRNFAATPTSSSVWLTVVEAIPCVAEQGFTGQRDETPRPFVIQLQGALPDGSSGTYSGADVRITSYLGENRESYIYLGNEARVWTAVTKGVKVEVKRVDSGNPAVVRGAVSWGGDYLPAQPRDVSSLVVKRALSYAQASTDSALTAFGASTSLPEAADLLELTCDQLAGGSAMVPVTLYVAGKRITDSKSILLGSVTVGPESSSVNGGTIKRFPIIPGEFSAVLYQVIGFPSSNGGAATFQIMASGRG
jgi:hypothetical protein